MSSRERSATFFSSDIQELPQGDNRYRVNPSVAFYVAQLLCGTQGCTLNISESARRVIHYETTPPQIVFETNRYFLQPANQLRPFVDSFLQRGCIVYVGGIAADQAKKIVPSPFIFVSDNELLARFDELHPPR